jgi:hypothetical protein
MRRQHGRQLPGFSDRPVEIAAQIITRQRLKQNFFDGIILVLDAAENLRRQRASRRHRLQAGGEQNLPA